MFYVLQRRCQHALPASTGQLLKCASVSGMMTAGRLGAASTAVGLCFTMRSDAGAFTQRLLHINFSCMHFTCTAAVSLAALLLPFLFTWTASCHATRLGTCHA